MKKAMSNVDVAAMVDELRDRLLGGHAGKAYQQSGNTIWLSMQSPAEGRLDLLMEAGKRVHITHKERPPSKTPPQFPTMLRSHVSGGRLVRIEQSDFDRLLEFTFEHGGEERRLIVELFPKGSMALTDGSGKVLTVLRKMTYRGAKIAAGEPYVYPPGQRDPRSMILGEISSILSTSTQDLVRTLVRNLNMSGTYGEEVCFRAGIDKNKPAAGLNPLEMEKVLAALDSVFNDHTLEPVIVLEDGSPVDVLPSPLKIYESMEMKRFGTFSDALDAYFIEEVPEEEKVSSLDRRIESQRKAMGEYEAKEKELSGLGELIYQRYGGVEAILKVISDARSKGFSYAKIWEKIKGSPLPAAKVIKSLDNMGEIKVDLDGTEVDLNAGLAVPQNAQRYYDRSKEMAKKAEGAKAALQITEELKESKGEVRKPKTRAMPKRRKPKWFERFRWFNSSEGFLVIGGRDSDQNEEIYAKYIEKRDIVLHTDAPGAPLTVIKTEGDQVDDITMQEAAQFAVSYSNLWKSGLAAGDCYAVGGSQVSKTPEPGEFLKKGAFVIRGARRYFRDMPLGLALGISDSTLVGGPILAVKRKVDPGVEVEPGEYNPDDLAKIIYRMFMEKIEDRAYLKAVASVDQIVQFLPPGGSRIKG